MNAVDAARLVLGILPNELGDLGGGDQFTKLGQGLGLGIKINSISSAMYIQSSAMDQNHLPWYHFQTVLHASPIPTLHAQ